VCFQCAHRFLSAKVWSRAGLIIGTALLRYVNWADVKRNKVLRALLVGVHDHPHLICHSRLQHCTQPSRKTTCARCMCNSATVYCCSNSRIEYQQPCRAEHAGHWVHWQVARLASYGHPLSDCLISKASPQLSACDLKQSVPTQAVVHLAINSICNLHSAASAVHVLHSISHVCTLVIVLVWE
jgi:hypothetical protein